MAAQSPSHTDRHAATRLHRPEYLIEATCLGLFMMSICIFGALLEDPNSAVRRIPMGSALAVGTWADF